MIESWVSRVSALVDSARFYRDMPGYIERQRCPITRIALAGGPPEGTVIVTSSDVALALLRQPRARLRGGEGNAFLRPVLGDHGVLVLDGDEHRRMRRTTIAAVQPYVDRAEQIAVRRTRRELARWRPGDVISLHAAAERILFDVMQELLLGNTRERAFESLVRASRSWGAFFVRHDFGPLSPVRRFRARLAEADAALLRALASPRVDTVAGALASAGLDPAAIRDTVVTLFLAGHGSTATAASWVVHDRLHFGAADAPIDAAIHESLRVHPPFELLVRRVRGGAVAIGPHVIADGAMVGISLSALHRDTRMFREPDHFAPARFATPPFPHAYLPYGHGARRCIGAGLAHAIIRAFATTILERTQLRVVGDPERRRRRGLTFLPARGARVIAIRVAP